MRREVEDRVDLGVAQSRAHRVRIGRGRRGRAGSEIAQRLRDAVRIDQRDRGAAVRAGGFVGEIDRARRIASMPPGAPWREASRARLATGTG